MKSEILTKDFKRRLVSLLLCLLLPPAFGVTGDVMFQAVLFDLQHVVKGSVQFLHSHFNGALNKYIYTLNIFHLIKCHYFI